MKSENALAKEFARDNRPWYFIAFVLTDYLWIFASLLICHFVSLWFYPLAFIIIGTRLHALAILMHDRIHSKMWNESADRLFTQIFLASPVLMSQTIYKNGHMKHHKFLFSDQDPDYLRLVDAAKDLKKYSIGMKVWKIFVNSTLSPALLKKQISGHEAYKQDTDANMVRVDRWINVAIFSSLFLVLTWFGVGHWLLVYWFLPLLLVTRTISVLRGVLEHDWDEHAGNIQKNSFNNLGSRAFEFLLFPHRVNYHLTHHIYPFVPFYHLKNLTEQLKELNAFDPQAKETYHLKPLSK